MPGRPLRPERSELISGVVVLALLESSPPRGIRDHVCLGTKAGLV
jgi:hypothetical protein